MAKVTSMLEKLNLIEKVDKSGLKDTIVYEDNNELSELLNSDESTHAEENNESDMTIEEPQSAQQYETYEIENNIDCEKKMPANEIYSFYGLENSNINTIFMLENLIKALPQDLPQEVIRQSVSNIITASNIDLGKLISDGKERLNALDELMENYNNEISNSINEYRNEIDRYTQLIKDAQAKIKHKEEVLEEQGNIVKYETQKIEGIIDFFEK